MAQTPISGQPIDCPICIEECVAGSNSASIATLICGHTFHLACIGCAFNMKRVMECPLCRVTEKSGWKFCNGNPRLREDEEEIVTQFPFFNNQVQQGLAQEVHVSLDRVRIALNVHLNVLPQRTNAEIARVTGALNGNLIQSSMVPLPGENNIQGPLAGNNDIAAGNNVVSRANPSPASQVSSEPEAESSQPPKRVKLFGRFID